MYFQPPPQQFRNGNNGIAVDNYGNPVQTQTYAPQQYYQQPVQQPVYQPLGSSFGKLVGGTPIPLTIITDADPEVVAKSNKRKKKAVEIKADNSDINPNAPDNIVYKDTYQDTTDMLKSTIAQSDQLASELKLELDAVRSSKSLKGKYMYLSNISSALGNLLNLKVSAIKEINNSIKASNDAEYRRYKDARAAAVGVDDNKAIMDMYNAYISTPVGTLQNYTQPTTLDITAGINNVIRVDNTDTTAGYTAFMNNITPEQNAIIQESNPDIEQVIVYDQATGKKYFDWVNLKTMQSVPNMPYKDPMFLEDYVIDPRKKIARNVNLNSVLKVVYINEGSF
jgi:hypothetical protein|nr:MAG TPA: hypothetical protein [Caudoviricetes sp.]